MANRDYYDILGVGRGIGEEDIRKAFRKKVGKAVLASLDEFFKHIDDLAAR